MIKIKIVEGRYCPVPFCDECGKEIEGDAKDDPGAIVYLTPGSEIHEGATFNLAFVHKNYAKNGNRCMDRWEKRHHVNETDETLNGWEDLERFAVYVFNNPGFRSGLHEKYRIEKGEIRSDSLYWTL